MEGFLRDVTSKFELAPQYAIRRRQRRSPRLFKKNPPSVLVGSINRISP
jgi:hypothetical protein